MLTTNERQRKFKDMMYKAGFKQVVVWVKRELPGKRLMSMESFITKVNRLISVLNAKDQGDLLNLFIKILEGKREVLKLRKKRK